MRKAPTHPERGGGDSSGVWLSVAVVSEKQHKWVTVALAVWNRSEGCWDSLVMLSCMLSQENAALRKNKKLFNCQFYKNNTLQMLLNRSWGRSRQVNPKLLPLLNPSVLLALLNHIKTNWQMAIHKILCNLNRNNTVAPKWFFSANVCVI